MDKIKNHIKGYIEALFKETGERVSHYNVHLDGHNKGYSRDEVNQALLSLVEQGEVNFEENPYVPDIIFRTYAVTSIDIPEWLKKE